ncbi:PepSY-associated TM helix domain-containing protein [Nocardia takedensis]|uniref:PepSY-associated TM helix domain-containing protein n=1 Tax=Nocardia takedensis TaxID=259390 RepID=UPI00031379C2|nr:PepSY-associated TM helix domain-containing protein [Nocardia takedensis]
MTTTEDLPNGVAESTPSAEPAPRRATGAGLQALALRLHFYAGVVVAPFILIAAITGALYAISPTLEQIVSRDLLTVEPGGTTRPLSEQVAAAVAVRPDLALVAVAPAPGAEDTTRVLFADPTLGESERRAVFIDPYTARSVGDSVVYGSSGALPLRTWIDRLHRDLHLGEPGRLYSEFAASWLWVIALAGLVLWIRRVRSRRARNSAAWLFAPDRSKPGRLRNMNWHGVIGVWILPLALLLSVTGMTWSTYAGENIGDLRQQLSWTTPVLDTALPGAAEPAPAHGDHHAGHRETAPVVDPSARIAQLDGVYAAARNAGINRGVEIAVPADETAFSVKQRRMPGTLTVDAVAVDGATATVTSRLPYAEWPLMAKLTNWGIQFHMGLMFGLLNQVLLLAAMLGLIVVILLGYRMWWQRRPARGARFGRAPRRGALRRSSPWVAVALLGAAAVIGWFAPLIGVGLIVFFAIDIIAGQVRRTAA